MRSLVGRLGAAVGGVARRLSPNSSPERPSNVPGVSPTSTNASTPASGVRNPAPHEPEHEIEAGALRDYAEQGPGDDSDEEGEEVHLHAEAVRNTANRGGYPFAMDGMISGAPEGWSPPPAPDDFKGYRAQHDAPANFGGVDNPGNWSEYTFQPKFDKDKKFVGCESPAKARVVPANSAGKREVNGWTFNYGPWEADEFDKETYVRGSATKDNMFPEERRGSLDVDVLKRHGINKHKVKNSPLAFLQLLLPICDPKQSGIPDDGRMPFVTDARQYTNTYATTDKGMGGAYNHHFDLVDEIELLRWMAVPIRHGARGGCPGHIHSRWCTSDDDYDKYISESMTFSRWKQIKSIFKMSNNAFTPKRGAEGYDPGSKYDLLYRVMVHNMNYVTKKAELDCGVDESTWGFKGTWGTRGAG